MPISLTTKKGKDNFDAETEKLLTGLERGGEIAGPAAQRDTALNTHVITGNLRRSWTYKVWREGSVIIVAVGSNVAYAPAEDERHGNLTPTINENAPIYFGMMIDEAKRTIGG